MCMFVSEWGVCIYVCVTVPINNDFTRTAKFIWKGVSLVVLNYIS